MLVVERCKDESDRSLHFTFYSFLFSIFDWICMSILLDKCCFKCFLMQKKHFIGPMSEQPFYQPLSGSCCRNLNDMTLADEDTKADTMLIWKIWQLMQLKLPSPHTSWWLKQNLKACFKSFDKWAHRAGVGEKDFSISAQYWTATTLDVEERKCIF